jgi:hypothetical protein
MSYEKSTASSMHDLLDKLRLFLIGDGWTVNKWAADSQMYQTWTGLTATGSMRLHVEKTFGATGEDIDTGYFNFRSAERLVLFENGYASAQQRNGRYYSEIRGIGINGSTSYDGSGNWDKEPGVPLGVGTNEAIGACITEVPLSSAFNYWFFSIGDSVIVVTEIASGIVMWMAFGRLKKAGSYPGGLFYAATLDDYSPSSSYWTDGYQSYRTRFLAPTTAAVAGTGGVYLTADAVAAWRHIGRAGASVGGYGDYIARMCVTPYEDPDSNTDYFGAIIFRRTPNTFNALCPMMPMYIMCKRASTRYSYLGYIEGLRIINCLPYDVGETFILGDTGGEEWHVFPAHQKGPDPDDPDCFLNPAAGFAVKKEL